MNKRKYLVTVFSLELKNDVWHVLAFVFDIKQQNLKVEKKPTDRLKWAEYGQIERVSYQNCKKKVQHNDFSVLYNSLGFLKIP